MKIIKTRILYRLLIALALALCLFPASGSPVAALNIDDYFTISYAVEFSSTEVYKNQVFQATVTGEAEYISKLPLTVSEAYVSGSVIAKHKGSGTEVVLNPSYTISISPFPDTVGEVAQASQTVTLQFPEESLPGNYSIIGELTEAKVKAVLWFNVTSYLPQLQAMGTISYMPPEPDDDEEENPEQPFTGTTYTEGNINQQGIITEAIIAPSVDNNCIITLEEGIKALDKNGKPLERINVEEQREPPSPSENCHFVSLVYDIGPDGVTFKAPAVLTIYYDEFQIPEGVSEGKLVIATWDETNRQWIELDNCIVDPIENTITAFINHFTAFAVLAHNAPASFYVSGLSISPTEVDTDGDVAVSIMVRNSGDLGGSYEVTLIIDNQVEETRAVTLEGQSSEVVTFTIARSEPGFYLLNVNGLPGSFTVVEGVVVEGEEDSPASSNQIEEPIYSSVSSKNTNWWLIGGIFIADTILLVIIVIWLLRRRNKARQSENEQVILSYDLPMPQDGEVKE